MSTVVPRVARKSTTVIQEGSKYRESYPLAGQAPVGTTARQEWRDSAGALIAEITGVVEGRKVDFDSPYEDVQYVPNGAGFYCYVTLPDDPDNEEMLRYGATFRRQLSFPHSPAIASDAVARQYGDTFQRTPGPVGGKWKTLVGRPHIYSNSSWTGNKPNTLGAYYELLDRFFVRYYVPFNFDTIDLSFSVTDKGDGKFILPFCCSADGSSYLYVGINTNTSHTNTCEVGYGTGPDIGNALSPQNLTAMDGPNSLTIPVGSLTELRARYDDVTKEVALYNADMTTTYASWVDDGQLIPHGRGYRYFGLGGRSSLIGGGCQAAYIAAQDSV